VKYSPYLAAALYDRSKICITLEGVCGDQPMTALFLTVCLS
jgi:hypothetical protein